MADDTPIATDFTPVMLIDRAATGGFEIIHDGRRYVFPKGEIELVGYVDLVKHIFRNDKCRVWTKPVACKQHAPVANLRECVACTPGEYVHRVAIKDAPGLKAVAKRLVADLGDEVLDDTPIDIDTTVAEGWSLEGRAGTTMLVPTGLTANSPEFRERLGQTRHPGALVARG